MLIIEDDLELIRIDKYELMDTPMEQPDESPHKLTGIGWLPLQIC